MSSITQPDARGHWGPYGGRFVPETLMSPLEELNTAYSVARDDAAFQQEFAMLLKDFSGRPTPLYFAQRLTELCGGARIFLQTEELLHTRFSQINNALGHVLPSRS